MDKRIIARLYFYQKKSHVFDVYCSFDPYSTYFNKSYIAYIAHQGRCVVSLHEQDTLSSLPSTGSTKGKCPDMTEKLLTRT